MLIRFTAVGTPFISEKLYYEVVVVAARLTDKQKKKIIADYVELESYNAVAKINNVSRNTVKNIVNGNADFAKKCQVKKEENTVDILSHMEKKKDKVNQIIDAYLEQLLDPETVKKATPSQLTTALGTLIDKFTTSKVINTGKTQEDDPLTKALKEKAEEMNNANI